MTLVKLSKVRVSSNHPQLLVVQLWNTLTFKGSLSLFVVQCHIVYPNPWCKNIFRKKGWNKSCCFLNPDKHRLCDERRNQRKHLAAGAKLLRQGAETDIWPDGKRLLSAIPEIRNLPSSPGAGWTAVKATWRQRNPPKNTPDTSSNDWFCTSEDSPMKLG